MGQKTRGPLSGTPGNQMPHSGSGRRHTCCGRSRLRRGCRKQRETIELPKPSWLDVKLLLASSSKCMWTMRNFFIKIHNNQSGRASLATRSMMCLQIQFFSRQCRQWPRERFRYYQMHHKGFGISSNKALPIKSHVFQSSN